MGRQRLHITIISITFCQFEFNPLATYFLPETFPTCHTTQSKSLQSLQLITFSPPAIFPVRTLIYRVFLWSVTGTFFHGTIGTATVIRSRQRSQGGAVSQQFTLYLCFLLSVMSVMWCQWCQCCQCCRWWQWCQWCGVGGVSDVSDFSDVSGVSDVNDVSGVSDVSYLKLEI